MTVDKKRMRRSADTQRARIVETLGSEEGKACGSLNVHKMRLCRREDNQCVPMKTGNYICKIPHARRELGHDENANASGGVRQAERSVGGAVGKIWGRLGISFGGSR